eukprot:scaffold49440_cov58-Phaeocystis_antarctica.AAC.3
MPVPTAAASYHTGAARCRPRAHPLAGASSSPGSGSGSGLRVQVAHPIVDDHLLPEMQRPGKCSRGVRLVGMTRIVTLASSAGWAAAACTARGTARG